MDVNLRHTCEDTRHGWYHCKFQANKRWLTIRTIAMIHDFKLIHIQETFERQNPCYTIDISFQLPYLSQSLSSIIAAYT